MPHRLVPGLSAVVLIAAALLASSAGLAPSLRREAFPTVAALGSSTERSVERVRGRLSGPDSAARMPAARAMVRLHARHQTPSGTGADGPRAGMALAAAWADADARAPREARRVTEVRHDGAPSPGQPASSPRAPPAA
jgi:hypothetical protein